MNLTFVLRIVLFSQCLFFSSGLFCSSKPYVLLVSIDGYRYDYNSLHKASYLNSFAKKGVQAESLKTVYPSKTFTNHLSIITGMYPENHGIVANHFFDPSLKKSFYIGDSFESKKSYWYKSLPIWGHLKRNGIKSACFLARF